MSVFRMPTQTGDYRSYIDTLYEAAAGGLEYPELRAGVDAVAAAMQRDIVEAPDTICATGKTYYISPTGDDTNDGLSPDRAWCTTQRLRQAHDQLQPGDAVLFERGGEWRMTPEAPLKDAMEGACGGASVFVGKKGVSYGAYGSGPKPILNGSPQNFADPALWEPTEWPNVWRCTHPFPNVGVVALNHSQDLGNYDEWMARKEMVGLHRFTGPADLRWDCSYYNNPETSELFFCSERGNPGQRFLSMEIGGRWSIVVDYSAEMIENFHFKFGGYGITGGPVVRVKNCIFSYLGGCKLSRNNTDSVVCGNAVEIYGEFDELSVERCWIYQVCDTGVTHQQWNKTGECIHKNVTFEGNVIEYCHWSIEFNNPPAEDGSVRRCENYRHAYNVLRRGGYGWGSTQFCRAESSTLYQCFGTAETVNGVCEKNILDDCAGRLYCLRLEGDHDIQFRSNLNLQRRGARLAHLYEQDYRFDERGLAELFSVSRQENPLFFVIE